MKVVMKKLVCILCVVVFFCSCNKSATNSSKDPEEFELGSLQKILDGYVVKAIAFDSKGNAWIGTQGKGLIRYNEKETVFYNSDNSVLPKEFVIWDVAVDKNDNVWIGESSGMWKYDGKQFTLYNSKNTAMPEDVAGSIAIDSKNIIWFASCRFKQGGLVKYDGSEWTAYTPKNSDLPDNQIKDIAIDQSDNVYLTLNDYLVKVSDDKWEIFDKNDLGLTNFIFAGIQFNSKNLLLGINDHSFNGLALQPPAELYTFDGKEATILSYIDDVTSIPGNTKITIDRNDDVWCFAIGKDCVVWKNKNKNWNKFDRSEFGGSSVWVIAESPDYRIWFGTENGIYIRF